MVKGGYFKKSYLRGVLRKINQNLPVLSATYFEFGDGLLSIPDFRRKDIPKVNLIILGSQKCGTTTLYNFLKKHPSLHMSSPMKESGYFCDFNYLRKYFLSSWNFDVKSKTWLLKRGMLKGFAGQQFFGDASTYYTIGQNSREQMIPERIRKEAAPDVKFIYIIRNPMERIISNYLHSLRRGYTNKSLQEVLDSDNSIIETSLYHYQLKPYLKHFGKERFCILQMNELRSSPETIGAKICNFLDIDSKKVTSSNLKASNVSDNRNKTDKKLMHLSVETKNSLIHRFNQDIERLNIAFGTDFHWPLNSI